MKAPRKPSNVPHAVKSAWYVDAFKESYLSCYPLRSDAAAESEIPFIRGAINAPAGATILDLCCGAGRHSRVLASPAGGFRMIALDLSADLLNTARKHTPKKAPIQYIRGDMRRLPLQSESFDGVVNLFTSFGYFSTDIQNEHALREAARVLRPGRRLVLDFFNVTFVRKSLVAESEKIIDGQRITERRWYDAKKGRLIKTVSGTLCGERINRLESVRAYTPTELEALFKAAGFKLIARYGDLSGSKFNRTKSPRCVIVGEKN